MPVSEVVYCNIKIWVKLIVAPFVERRDMISSKVKGWLPEIFLRYFHITPRLQRLYTSPYVAKEIWWHGEQRVCEGLSDLRHPANGEGWKHFNMQFPNFLNEIRNVRLGLATDGFNPFGVVSTSHNNWHIVVMPYNLPPSMCLKKEFNILVMLISGLKLRWTLMGRINMVALLIICHGHWYVASKWWL